MHPAYSGVTLGLFHGSVPHALVLCHRAGTTEVEGYPGHPLPSLTELVALHEQIALARRPAGVAAIALNTAGLDDDAAAAAVASAAEETGCRLRTRSDDGADGLLDAVLASVGAVIR